MSKISFNKGNHDYTGYDVISEMPVDNIRATEYNGIKKQLITTTQVLATQEFTQSMSGNGLWIYFTPLYNQGTTAVIYGRSNINEQFVFYQNMIRGHYSRPAFSHNGEHFHVTYPGGSSYFYSRNLQTNLWTSVSRSGGHSGGEYSNDALYYIYAEVAGIKFYKRTPGTNTWSSTGVLIGFPVGFNTLIFGDRGYVALSKGADRIVAHSRQGFTVYKKTSDTTWKTEQSQVGWVGPGETISLDPFMNEDGDLIFLRLGSSNVLYERIGTTWSLAYTFPPVIIFGRMSYDGNRILLGDHIYKKITNNDWRIIYTFDASTSYATGWNRNDINLDCTIVSRNEGIETWIYDITNEVSFDQSVNTKFINFNDTLKLTSAYESVDHLVTFPPFNQAGSLINDGSGNCIWDTPFDQCLNKDCAVQFDSIGLSPNLGQTTTSAQLQLSMRLLNDSYTGNCIKVRRGTDFTVAYSLDTELDDSSNLSGSSTYTSTGGTSSRGQFTATLSTSGTFIVDGDSLSSVDDGTRILFVGQNNQDENGIYTTTISGTSLTLNRSTDFDGGGEVINGDSFYITAGATYSDTGYKITTVDDIIIGGASGSDLNFSNIDVLKDIGFSNGTIDVAGLSNLLEDDTGYVNTWYDQSVTNNFDFTQSIQDSQPQILLSGGINWLPTVSFDGTDDYLDAGDVLDIGTNTGWFVNLVSESNATGGAVISKSSDNDNNRWGVSFRNGNLEIIYEDSVDSSTSNAQSSGNPQIISLLIDRNSGTKTFNSYIDNSNIDNNVSITEDSTYNFNSITGTLLGAIDDQGLKYMTGNVSEIIIHNFVLTTAERVGIEQEQANYYGITITEMPKLNFKIDTTIAADYSLTFPGSQGLENQTLLNDGSGNLSWGNSSFKVRTETTGTTLGNDNILNMNNSGTETVNVPDATTAANLGVKYVIIKQTANQVDITSVVASQLFSGGSTFTTISLSGGIGERLVLLCNGVYWFVM